METRRTLFHWSIWAIPYHETDSVPGAQSSSYRKAEHSLATHHHRTSKALASVFEMEWYTGRSGHLGRLVERAINHTFPLLFRKRLGYIQILRSLIGQDPKNKQETRRSGVLMESPANQCRAPVGTKFLQSNQRVCKVFFHVELPVKHKANGSRFHICPSLHLSIPQIGMSHCDTRLPKLSRDHHDGHEYDQTQMTAAPVA